MKLEDIKSVGVMGAGVMGGAIGQTLALNGYKAIIRDLNDEILTRARSVIEEGRFGLKQGVERGKITQQQLEQALVNLSYTTKVEDLKDCDLIIEAIPENLELKREVWAELDKLVKKGAIFATNTSGFCIQEISQAVARRELFIGMHWFSPANIMRLIEIICTPQNSEGLIQLLEELCHKLGKETIRVKDALGTYGFVANRIFGAATREARKILEEGITSEEDINKAMALGYNWPVGPLALGRGVRAGWA
jgi:3-hydroxyacyl-CoA dehydrogenase